MGRAQHITAAEIAQRLDLSRTTVSLVLSGRARDHRIAESTANRILETARLLRYRPNAAARQLAGKRSDSVGVLVTSEMMADLRLIEAMEVLAAERGVRFIVGHAVGSPAQVRDYLDDFRSRGVDGLFCFFHHHPRHREVLLPELSRFPNVVFYEKPVGPIGSGMETPCCVGPDFFEVGQLGVRHLVDRGRRRIGLVFRELLFPYATQRRRAYEAVMADVGRPFDERLVWVRTERTPGRWTDPFTPELALLAVDDLVVARQVDGIVAVNDLYAGCLINAIRKRGRRVPEDVAVVGCDNLEFGTFVDPPITTIDLRLQEVAQALVRTMFELLDHHTVTDERRETLIQPELIVRGSS
jgi:LacI family transcriptional regulator